MKLCSYLTPQALLLITALLLSGCQKPSPVTDWRYTRWGMSASEVTAASKGTAVPADPSDQPHERSRDNQVLLKAPVSWQGLSFTAYFAFEPGTGLLSSITLELQNATASSNEALLGLLNRQYGRPYSGHEDASTKILVWQSGHDQVGFIKLSDPRLAVGAPATSVSYQSLNASR
jgi:hypothetical protein